MVSLSDLRLDTFRRVLTDERTKPLKLMYVAMASGVSLLSGAVVALFVLNDIPVTPNAGTLNFLTMLSFLHWGAVCILYSAAYFLFQAQFTRGRLERTAQYDVLDNRGNALSTLEEKTFLLLRTAFIVRLAMMQAPAMIGLIVCMVGIITGALKAQPLYWVNIISTAIFFVFVAQTFPNNNRLEQAFTRYVRKLSEQ